MLTPAAKIAEDLEPIADLMTDPTVTEIQVRRGGQHVFVERDGRTRLVAGRTFPYLEEAIRGIAGACGRDVPAACPVVDARLEAYDARMAAMLPPNARGGAMMTIRLFPRRYTLDELVERAMLSAALATTLRTAVHQAKTLLIAGAGGSGKTTLLGALLREVPEHERVCIIEEEGEIVSENPYVTQMEARGMLESLDPARVGRPPVSLGALVRASLRHSPGRILIGEVRGEEAAAMLMAMNTGHQGGITTIHANSAEDALRRLAQCATLASYGPSYEAAKADVGRTIHGAVHVAGRTVRDYLTVHGYDSATDVFRVHHAEEFS